jgi:hypothetical protein
VKYITAVKYITIIDFFEFIISWWGHSMPFQFCDPQAELVTVSLSTAMDNAA